MSLREQLTHIKRADHLEEEALNSQIIAVKNLVEAAATQLHQHGRNTDRFFGRRWQQAVSVDYVTAYFQDPEFQVLIQISSVGPQSEKPNIGLFIYVGQPDRNRNHQIVGIQTAKQKEAVHESEALWLSGFTPAQLDLVTQVISRAKPIKFNRYKSLLWPG